ncbi:hypothetical protein BDV96DRAFT_604499 [Lophiotrema nucula]|uniref:Uncharacterized protein n=1 Tax=Lophiotrema nucula TaxID=690887 RepID=A0A6A5YRK0_9PLEO|nr:hypothetical protein BDV96DRAFT_604499 [Lophiotrema nucula]
MARQRLPHVSAWLQIVFRLVSLVACHGCLLTCIYILYTFHTSNALIYLAILWTLVIDNAEILALYTKPGDGIWRFRLWPLVAWEAVGILLFLGSAFLSFHGDKSKHKDGESEARINYETAKWSLIFLIIRSPEEAPPGKVKSNLMMAIGSDLRTPI